MAIIRLDVTVNEKIGIIDFGSRRFRSIADYCGFFSIFGHLYLILTTESVGRETVEVIASVLNKATIDNNVADWESNCKSFNKATKYSYFLSCSTLLAQGVVKN